MMTLPVQEVPSPVNPSLHSQVYELMVSIHVAFLLQVLEIHSSISKTFNVDFIDNNISEKFPDWQEPNAWNS